MSKVLSINKESEETFIALLKDNIKVNVWCDKRVKDKITDSEFGKIVRISIDKLSVLKGYLVGMIFLEDLENTMAVHFCIDEENSLNIDSIYFLDENLNN
tara:strand:+ start:5233 stop:5532 length:300 start_codon:yes stop_codon:yes gene_type:complete